MDEGDEVNDREHLASEQMVLVVSGWRGNEISRRKVDVKRSAKRIRIISGLNKDDVFNVDGSPYSAALRDPMRMYRHRLEPEGCTPPGKTASQVDP